LRFDKAEEHFLRYIEQVWPNRFIANNPSGMIRTGTKAFLLSLRPRLRGLMPPVALCNNIDNVMSFREEHPDMVLKVLRSCGGKGVVRFRAHGETDLSTREEAEAFIRENGACLAMEYLDNPEQSDNRLIVLDGEILGAIRRVPRPGGWLCNLSAGGSYEIAEPDAREKEMVRRIAPHLRALGVHYYGVDTLMAADGSRMLSEINTTNAGGAWRYERVTGRPVCQRIADQFVDCALETLREGRLPA
jgi:glutathione synthase